MTMPRHFEFHDEVIALHALMTATWAGKDPNSSVAKYPAGYSETFLDMARAITQAGFHRTEIGTHQPIRAEDSRRETGDGAPSEPHLRQDPPAD